MDSVCKVREGAWVGGLVWLSLGFQLLCSDSTCSSISRSIFSLSCAGVVALGAGFSDVNTRVLGVLFTVGSVLTVGQVSGTQLSVLVCTVWFSAILIGPGRWVGGSPPRGLGVRGGHMYFWWYAFLRRIEAWLWRCSEAPQERSLC